MTSISSRALARTPINAAVRLLVAGLFALPLRHAGAATEADAQAGDSAQIHGTVTIQGNASRPLAARGVFSSVDILGSSLLEDQHVDYSWELLAKAPGVQLTQFKQGTVGGRFSFRGFNGEGRVNAVKLLIDGIPSNDNAGGMPYLDAVFPLEIDAIEIVRGTNDPRYGLHNIAGNVDVVTRQGGNEGRASVTAGSFGTREVQLAQGIETDNWSQNYFAAYRRSEGYRDHADGEKFTLSGKWFYTSDSKDWKAGLMARFYRDDALEAGYLSQQEAVRAPRSSPVYADADRSHRDTAQLSLHVDAHLRDDLFWSTKAYVNYHDTQRWVRFSAASAQQERDNDERHRGVSSTMTWRPKVSWATEFALEAGVDAQWQDNVAERFRTAERVRTSQFRSWQFDQASQGAYVQAVIRPTRDVKIIPAIRFDHIDGDFLDRQGGVRSPMHDYGLIRQPKLSVIYAFDPRYSAYANWGRTFQIGSGIDAYRTQARDLEPSLNDGWEGGLKFHPWSSFEGRVSVWEQRASGEVATVLGVGGLPDPGGMGNVGKTRRNGYDVQFSKSFGRQTSAWFTYSHQLARITVPDASAPATLGKQVENVPNYLLSAGVSHQVNAQLKLTATANGQGDHYLERSNTLPRDGGYFLLNLGAAYRVSPALSVDVQLKNVTDRKYGYAFSDSGVSGYSPGDGRQASVSMNWRY